MSFAARRLAGQRHLVGAVPRHRGVSGCAQCHIHTGYSSSCAPVRGGLRPPRPARPLRGRDDRRRARSPRTMFRRAGPRESRSTCRPVGPRGRRSPRRAGQVTSVRADRGRPRHGASSARRSVFEPAALRRREIRVRRPAVACRHHLHAHTRYPPSSLPSHRSRTSRRRDALPITTISGHEVRSSSGSSSLRLEPDLRRGSAARQRPGREPGGVAQRWADRRGAHRRAPASRPSCSRSRSAWLCRT